MEYDWESLKAKLKVNDVIPSRVMTVTREDLIGRPQIIGNSCAGLYPVREQIEPVTPKFERSMTSSIVHLDESAYGLPVGKPGQVLANGEKGLEWRDPPSK